MTEPLRLCRPTVQRGGLFSYKLPPYRTPAIRHALFSNFRSPCTKENHLSYESFGPITRLRCPCHFDMRPNRASYVWRASAVRLGDGACMRTLMCIFLRSHIELVACTNITLGNPKQKQATYKNTCFLVLY